MPIAERRPLFLPNVSIRINYPYNRAVGWRLIAFEWKRSFLAATPKDQFTDACANRVKSDGRFPFGIKIGVKRLHDEKFSPSERSVLDGGNYRSDYACDLHSGLFFQLGDHRFDPFSVGRLWSQIDVFLQFCNGFGPLLFHHVNLSQIQMSERQLFAAF